MIHTPVMVEEVMEYLKVKEGGTYIDATAGGGGHLRRIIEAVGERGKVIGIDQNKSAVEHLKKTYEVIRGNYKFIEKITEKVLGPIRHISPIGRIDGIFFDLGFSSDEIAEKGRGFSFEDDESLDMRYSHGETGEFIEDLITAGEVVNSFSENELAGIFWNYGDEKRSRFFAKKIVEYRHRRPIESAMELAYVVGNARPTFERFQTLVRHAHARPLDLAPSGADSKNFSVVLDQHFQNGQKVRGRAFQPSSQSGLRRTNAFGRLNPATKVFMALRIFVNREFENIEAGLHGAVSVLKSGGRCVILSFHSGEDKIVKEFIKEQAAVGKIENLTKHVVKPLREEVLRNRLSRSAVMRAFEKK